jgi:hypothetical protein
MLGGLPRPCAELCLPEVQLEGVLRSYRKHHVLGTVTVPYPVRGMPEMVELECFPVKDHVRMCEWADSFQFELLSWSETDSSEGLEREMRRGIDRAEIVYDSLKKRKEDFGFEIILDSGMTTKTGFSSVLEECGKRGIGLTSIAPGIGFVEGRDYHRELDALEARVKSLCDGRVLPSIRNGGGTSPYSGKGAGVYKTVARATNERVKYCASAPYRDLIFWVLCYSDRGRQIFRRAYARVVPGEGRMHHRDPAFRRRSGEALEDRVIRREVTLFYRDDREFREALDREVERFTSRLIRALGLQENVKFLTRQ